MRQSRQVAGSALTALLAVSLALLGLALTVRFSYGGDWTGLYCTGGDLTVPPSLASTERIYRFSHSNGYDGQF